MLPTEVQRKLSWKISDYTLDAKLIRLVKIVKTILRDYAQLSSPQLIISACITYSNGGIKENHRCKQRLCASLGTTNRRSWSGKLTPWSISLILSTSACLILCKPQMGSYSSRATIPGYVAYFSQSCLVCPPLLTGQCFFNWDEFWLSKTAWVKLLQITGNQSTEQM